MKPTDLIDQKIIKILVEDSSRSYQEIADQVFLSRSAVDKRINRLKKEGIISKFTIELSDTNSHYSLLLIKSFKKNCAFIFNKLCTIHENFVFERLCGEYDSIARIQSVNLERLHEIQQMLNELEEVESVLMLPIISVWER